MQVGRGGGRRSHWVDDDHGGGRLGQPVVVRVGRRCRRIRAPDEYAGGIAGRPRVEARHRGPEDVLECNVPGLVADRVRVDLGRPETVEEAQGEEVAEKRERPRVVGVQDRLPAGASFDLLQPRRDLGERFVPGDGLESALPLGADPAERARQPRLRIEERSVVADRALVAELPPAHRVVGVSPDVSDRPVALDDHDAAGVVAVARAGRENYVVSVGGQGLAVAYDRGPAAAPELEEA